MMSYLLIIALILFFFGLVPGLGAFYTRSRWRKFRRSITDASFFPAVGYDSTVQRPNGFIGYYRFWGSLEAIQGSDTIWVRSGNLSLSAELGGVPVYLLPSYSFADVEGVVERNEVTFQDEMPARVSWNRIFTLPEGTQLSLSGALFAERGHRVFRSDRKHALTVIIYEGDRNSILRRSIWGGRQRNEYWNQFTPTSLITGSIALLFLAYNFFRMPLMRLPAIVSLLAGVSPVLPFFPPGLLLFFLYRYLWKRGRLNRAERDLLRLPMRYFDPSAVADGASVYLPDGEHYRIGIFTRREEAHEALSEGKIRTTSLLRRRPGRDPVYWIFGKPIEKDGEIRYGQPDDPMAEPLLIPGNPVKLSSLCNKQARINELLAACSFAAGYLLNAILALLALSLWFR